MTEQPIIVKVGGGASINTEGIIKDLAGKRDRFIIVLGANAVRDDLAVRLNSPVQTITSVSGYDSVFSDKTALEMIMMTYAGLARNRFVECCQKHGINAIGLSGLDGGLIRGRRNSAIRTRQNGKLVVKRDLSGKPTEINTKLLTDFLRGGYTPVLSIPIADAKGYAINADNDNIVAAIHRAIGSKRIYQFIEAPGLLADIDDPNSLIKTLDLPQLKAQQAVVKGRMRRKLLALGKLFEHGPAEIVIADGRAKTPYLDAKAGKGTIIR